MKYTPIIIIFCILLTACSTPIETINEEGYVHVIQGREIDYRCTLKPDTGNCEAKFSRYWYNNAQKKCEEFTWGGCSGIVPFEALSECKTACEPSPCTLKPEAGPCKAAIQKYYYNTNTNNCEEFTWGGCSGIVPFDTLNSCQNFCKN